jgi:hypothetical protein
VASRAIGPRAAAVGAVTNGVAGLVARRLASPESLSTSAVRATGNGTFVAFAAPFLLREAGRPAWWSYVGAHAAHVAYLVQMANRAGGSAGSFSATSRYGGAAGYATVSFLTVTGYVPSARAPRRATLAGLQHGGETLLFGLYGFTIVHGFLAKGRNWRLYGPFAALWLEAARRARARWGG